MSQQLDILKTSEVELKETGAVSTNETSEVIVYNIVTGEVMRYDTLGKALVATGEYGSIMWIQGMLYDKASPLKYLTYFIYRYANDSRDFSDAVLYKTVPSYIVKNYATGRIYKLDSPRQVEGVLGKTPESIFSHQHKNGINSRLFKDCFLILDEDKQRIHWPQLTAKKRTTRKKTKE